MNYAVCTAVNDKFARGAEVMLFSFLSNNDWFEGDIIILSGEEGGPMYLSNENKERLSNLYYKVKFKEENISHFKDIFEKIKYNALSGTETLLYKLSVFELDEYDRILFLDSDLLIIADIKEIFDKNEPLVACADRIDDAYKNAEWVVRNEEYFNFGMFVLNKPYIHEKMLADLQKVFAYVNFDQKTRSNPCCGSFVDQDIANAYFLNKNALLAPYTYNFDRFLFDEGNNEGAKIIHYLETNKPWENDIVSPSNNIWKEYENKYENWLNYYELNWGNIHKRYKKQYDDKHKYVVFTCAKNENNYIIEWIEHYLNLGFDKIFICDNNDDDKLLRVINKYIEDGCVEVFDCRHFTMFQGGVNNMFCTAGNFAWCGFFDCDEFLELGVYDNIKEYLSDKEEDCIAFNWVMYGSNGEIKKEKGSVQERFKKPVFPIVNMNNAFLKCIIRGGHFKYTNITDCGGHLPVSNEKGHTKKITYNIGGYHHEDFIPYLFQSSLPLRYKEGYIKHYYTKSFEEWVSKAKRGWPLENGSLPYSRYFYLNDNGEYTNKTYYNNLFINDNTLSELNFYIDDLNDKNNIINFINKERITYAFLSKVFYVMSRVTGKTFILSGEGIDDTIFNMIFECGFATDNRVVFAKNDKEKEKCFKRYKNETSTGYYYITL